MKWSTGMKSNYAWDWDCEISLAAGHGHIFSSAPVCFASHSQRTHQERNVVPKTNSPLSLLSASCSKSPLSSSALTLFWENPLLHAEPAWKKSYLVTAATFGQTSITSSQLLGFLYHFFSFSSNIHNVISTPSTRSPEYTTWLRKFSNCTHTASQNTQRLSKLSFKISM